MGDGAQARGADREIMQLKQLLGESKKSLALSVQEQNSRADRLEDASADVAARIAKLMADAEARVSSAPEPPAPRATQRPPSNV